MTTTMTPRDHILAFGKKYNYDMGYQLELLDHAPNSFEAYAKAQQLSHTREILTIEQHYSARISFMLAERCGDCVEINSRMAIEAGLPQRLVDAITQQPCQLEGTIRDIHEHAFDVAANPVPCPDRLVRLRERLGRGGLAELGVCFAGCRLFTTLKRTLSMTNTVLPATSNT